MNSFGQVDGRATEQDTMHRVQLGGVISCRRITTILQYRWLLSTFLAGQTAGSTAAAGPLPNRRYLLFLRICHHLLGVMT